MVDFELKHTGLLWLQRMVLACLLCVVGFTHAETATDVDAETVVVGKILKDQQSATQKETTAEPEIKIQQPSIANDMAYGESIRGLPTLNEPVVDQANLLSAAEKQAISQKILQLHEDGKAQIGVVIVPTTLPPASTISNCTPSIGLPSSASVLTIWMKPFVGSFSASTV